MRAVQNLDSGEPINMSTLTEQLQECFAEDPPVDYVPGKTLLRDAVMTILGWQATEAEELVDSMENDGYIQFIRGDPFIIGGAWTFEPRPGFGEEMDR
jgi:hypothetical protein